jgi:hypothetical protein
MHHNNPTSSCRSASACLGTSAWFLMPVPALNAVLVLRLDLPHLPAAPPPRATALVHAKFVVGQGARLATDLQFFTWSDDDCFFLFVACALEMLASGVTKSA